MLIIVTYDVSTETRQGKKRLRQVAKICEAVGQRVQKSVFECQINLMQYEELERQLLAVIDQASDSIRLYRLSNRSECSVKEYGNFRATDFKQPLVL